MGFQSRHDQYHHKFFPIMSRQLVGGPFLSLCVPLLIAFSASCSSMQLLLTIHMHVNNLVTSNQPLLSLYSSSNFCSSSIQHYLSSSIQNHLNYFRFLSLRPSPRSFSFSSSPSIPAVSIPSSRFSQVCS